MSCDAYRERLNAGAPLDPDTLTHVQACPACRDEFAHVLALRSSRPQPPPGLRDRVLASFPARAVFAWRAPAWAASVAAALVVGYLLGQPVGYSRGLADRPAPEVRVVEVPVEKVRVVVEPAPPRASQVSTLAIALATVYKSAVTCEWKGHSCRQISASREIAERYPMCPLIREAKELEKSNPELVTFK